MTKRLCQTIILTVAALSPAAAATPEQIGSWVLDCSNAAACQLRSNKRFLEKGAITGDLEVRAQGKTLVPVIALRGLPADLLAAASMAGKAEASMQFPGTPREELDCSISTAGYFCAPKDNAAQILAARLPTARSVTVRVSVTVTGMNPLPAQEKSLDLSGTTEALQRLRTVGPPQLPGPMTALTSQSPAGLMAMADKALKAAGYQNGIASLQSMLAKYMKK